MEGQCNGVIGRVVYIEECTQFAIVVLCFDPPKGLKNSWFVCGLVWGLSRRHIMAG